MEGVRSEAVSLAGHPRSSNLRWINNRNRITIKCRTDIAFAEDVAARFLAYRWNILCVTDATDLDLLENAYRVLTFVPDRPTPAIEHQAAAETK
jgi:transketolase